MGIKIGGSTFDSIGKRYSAIDQAIFFFFFYLKTLPLDLVSLAFLCYFLFWEERDMKFEQKYLFNPNFNRGGLRKTNGTYLRWVKSWTMHMGCVLMHSKVCARLLVVSKEK